ncbi:MAG: glycoside hydrolase family 2 protein [Acutalibacteraceae bacterium]
MKKIELFNEGWTFEKQGQKETVNLPHTWNAVDGQGGDITYYKGKCTYTKIIGKYPGKVFIEFAGVNNRCTVMVNGRTVGSHKGGYSTFRFELTDFLTSPKNFIEVAVDNSNDKTVYPDNADFTFYGGIYRYAKIIYDVPEEHFSLTDAGSKGVYITPKINGDVYVKALISGYKTGVSVLYEVLDKDGKVVAKAGDRAKLHVNDPILWNGFENPYLYTLRATLTKDGETMDVVELRFGFREIRFDADKGCFLNGKYIKLKGVSRHQDREGLGNALTIKEHQEDLEIIKEVGANSLRLAHYQQAEEFYSLCDEMGFLVWAEVPVISKFSAKKQENALSQLEELIKQNMHHASIFCWGIENEITIQGENPKLLDNIKQLNDYAHFLDPSRPTTCAQLTMCPVDAKLNQVTDIMGYNHYYGWYMKTCDGIDEWLPKYKEANPNQPLCLSEYGAEAVLGYYSDNPVQGDYSEGYQARFHEHYLNTICNTQWLWGSYVWNMFDFGSAIRNEGGVKGRNNKGLVSFDRKTRKDSFYVYKAFWSDERFVHIEGSRYKYRTIGEHDVRVESSCKSVTLTCGDYKKTLRGEHVFTFENVPFKEGENVVKVSSGNVSETAVFECVNEYPREYSLPDGCSSMVRNWFVPKSDEIDPDCYGPDDYIGDILADEEIKAMASGFLGNIISNPLVKLITKRMKLGTLLNMNIGIDQGMKDMVLQYLQTVKKK